MRSNIVASQADAARALRRRRAGDRVAPAPRAGRPRRARGAGRRRRVVRRPRAVAVTAGPGLIGALLVGVSAAKAYAYAAGLPLIPVDHLHGHVASLFLEPEPLEPPFLCLLASGGHTLLLDVRRPRPLLGARPEPRRRRGRGVRQGRAPARPRLPRRPGDRAGGGRRRPGGGRAAGGDGRPRGPRPLVLGPEDGALRTRLARRGARTSPTWPRPTRPRSWRAWSRARPGARR